MRQTDLHTSVRNPHPASVHAPQQRQGGAAPTLPPQRPNHTPFLLGLACLGSGSCSQNRRPSQARVRPWRGGAGDVTPVRPSPAERRPPNVRLCPGAEHFGPPGPELAARCSSAVSPLPAPPPPLPSPTRGCNWSRAEGGQGQAPSPDRPGPLG